jgi:hypothetical protein
MIKLREIINKGYEASQAILTNDPVELHFSEQYEGRHVDIVNRLFPKEMEELMKQAEDMGYDDETLIFEAAETLCNRKGLARILIEGERLFFNTHMHQPLTSKQEMFLKDYCRRREMELVQDFGGSKYRKIELYEIRTPVPRM